MDRYDRLIAVKTEKEDWGRVFRQEMVYPFPDKPIALSYISLIGMVPQNEEQSHFDWCNCAPYPFQ